MPRAESTFTTAGDLVCRRCESREATSRDLSGALTDPGHTGLAIRRQRASWGDFALGFLTPWIVLAALFSVVPAILGVTRLFGASGSVEGWIYGGATLSWPSVLGVLMVLGWRRGRASFSAGVAVSGGLVLGAVLLLAVAFGSGMSRAL